MSDRKEITKFLGNLLENQYFSGIGKYWAKEVSVDLGSTEKAKRVDYMQFVPENQCSVSALEKGSFFCYEIKSCKADIYSGNGLNFLGEKNYIVTTAQCYKEIYPDLKNRKLDKYIKENYPDSSLHYGIIVAIPTYSEVVEEIKNPTKFDCQEGKWKLCVAKRCSAGLRKNHWRKCFFVCCVAAIVDWATRKILTGFKNEPGNRR